MTSEEIKMSLISSLLSPNPRCRRLCALRRRCHEALATSFRLEKFYYNKINIS